MAKVQYCAVTHRYPGADLPTVDNLDLDIADGEFWSWSVPPVVGSPPLCACWPAWNPLKAARLPSVTLM